MNAKRIAKRIVAMANCSVCGEAYDDQYDSGPCPCGGPRPIDRADLVPKTPEQDESIKRIRKNNPFM